jgi:hypothetical protein
MRKTLSHSEWTLEDFSRNLNLVNEGWDPQHDFDSSMLTHEELETAFGKREHNGWKARPNEPITRSNCVGFEKVHELVYGHVATNGDYLAIFLHGWLV